MEFKEKIRMLRRSAGITQKELANSIGVTYRTYQNYESGASMPSSKTLTKLATILEVSIDMLTSADHSEEKMLENPELAALLEATEKLFMNDRISDCDKQFVIESLTSCFWRAKENQKYTRKKKNDVGI